MKTLKTFCLLTLLIGLVSCSKDDYRAEDAKPADGKTIVQTSVLLDGKLVQGTIHYWPLKGYLAADLGKNHYDIAASNFALGFALLDPNPKHTPRIIQDDDTKTRASNGGYGSTRETIKLPKNSNSCVYFVHIAIPDRNIATYGYLDIYEGDTWNITANFPDKAGSRPDWNSVVTANLVRKDGTKQTHVLSVAPPSARKPR